MARNYHVEGEISFYVNGSHWRTLSFDTTSQRKRFIQDFYNRIAKITTLTSAYYDISIKEKSVKMFSPKKSINSVF